MSSKIFETILTRKIDNFVSTFVDDSNSIFYNEGQLIHPGEYGRYRENTLKDLLNLIVGTEYKISDGFIITSKDQVSTQCDVVIYENTALPILENNSSQFFTIESVMSLGEVKSTLSKSDLKKALLKLSEIKKLSDNCSKNEKIRYSNKTEYDLPFSFLVCKNIKTDIENIDFEEIYKNVDKKYWHNCILSIEDGLLTYCFKFNQIDELLKKSIRLKGGNPEAIIYSEYPMRTFDKTYDCESDIIKINSEKKYDHIKMFINMMIYAHNKKTIYIADLVDYLNLPKSDLFPNE